MKVLGIATDRYTRKVGYGGVAYYRLVAPGKAANLELDVPRVIPKDYAGYDLVISKHIDNAQAAKRVKLECERAGIPLVYDLDDNLLAIREDQPAYSQGYAQGEMKRIMLATNLSFADALFVSTQPLKDYYQNFFKEVFGLDMPIFVLPNYNDAELFNFENLKNKRGVCIGYQGSVTHDSDLALVLPVIDRLMEEHRDLSMEIVGSVRRESIGKLFDTFKHKNRVGIRGGTATYAEFPEFLMKQRWDIGIAPLIDDEFNRGKSHIKYLEYSMKKIPTIASDIYPYRENAQEALLASSPEDWYKHLKSLITSPRKRHSLGEKAYKHVIEEQQYKDHGYLWDEACRAVINQHKKTETSA